MSYIPLLLIGLIVAWFIFRTLRLRGVETVEPARVREMVRDRNLLLLDVRTPGEVSQRKMKGAINIPLHELPSRVTELEQHRGKNVVVVCASGSRSLSGARILSKHGFQAASMTGGLMAWLD